MPNIPFGPIPVKRRDSGHENRSPAAKRIEVHCIHDQAGGLLDHQDVSRLRSIQRSIARYATNDVQPLAVATLFGAKDTQRPLTERKDPQINDR